MQILRSFCRYYIAMPNQKIIIAPSILSADFANLEQQCKHILECGADMLHIDIMDGHFVPNLTIGPPVVKALKKKVQKAYFDCHIMVTHPQNYIQDLSKAGASCITFHYQAQYQNIAQLCKNIKQSGIDVGLSLKPKTQINDEIENLIKEKLVDKVLVMTVEPGFGGQKFMADMMGKVKHLREKYPQLEIQVDGGISLDTIQVAAKHGANNFVSGSGIYGSQDKKGTIGKMKEIAQKHFKSECS